MEVKVQNFLEKKNLNNSIGIRIGFLYELIGKVGYVTETKDFESFQAIFEQIKEESKSEIIIIDVTNLKRWDTLSLKVVFPAIIQINKELLIKGKPLIGIIGNKATDVFDASYERHRESGTELIPWFDTREDYFKKYSL